MRAVPVTALRVWVLAAGTLPWALALARVRHADLVLAFHTLCHQLPERTLSILGAPMLVCSRCAGVYAGVALGTISPLPARWLPHAPRLLAAAAALMLLEVAMQDLGLYAVWHAARLGTGLALGWSASAWMFRAIAPRNSDAWK